MFPEISRAYVRRAAEVFIQLKVTRESTIQSALKTALGVDRARTASAATGGAAVVRRKSGGVPNYAMGTSLLSRSRAGETSDAMRFKLELVNALAAAGKRLEDDAVSCLRLALREQM